MTLDKSFPGGQGGPQLGQGAGGSGEGAIFARRSQPLPTSLASPSVSGKLYLFACRFSHVCTLEDISSELKELNKLREAAERKKERDRAGSKRCSSPFLFIKNLFTSECRKS